MIPEMMIREPWRYMPHTFAEVVSNKTWKGWNYLRYAGRRIALACVMGGGRIIFSVPPRHGKSELISKHTPAWFLDMWPVEHVILTTYESDFAASWGRKTRDLVMASDKVRTRVNQKISATQNWETMEGGGMITAGVGGPITGKGGKLIIIDDPIKNWQEAQSPTIRKNIIDWFNSTVYPRAEPGATIILLMTRWHENDLAGYLENEHEDNWEVIKFPAIAEKDDVLGRKEGEALCPDRFDLEALARIQKAIGSYLWAGLYQQRPSPEGGGIIKREWFTGNEYDQLPKMEKIIQSWDTAFKKGKKTARSCCETWGKGKDGYYLINVWKDKVEYPELKRMASALYEKEKPSIMLIEDEASGQSLTQELKRGIDGNGRLPVKGIPCSEGEGKIVRARLVSPLIEAGMVHVPKHASWLADFLDEVVSFPTGDYADQVDSMTQALKYLRGDMKEPGLYWV